MNVFITTIGTRGDVQPYVALAEGLRRAGHAVTVCTSTRYASLVEERGLAFRPLSDDLVALVETPEGRAAIAGAGGAVSGARAIVDLVRRSRGIQRALYRDGWAAAQEVAPDLIVYHPKMSVALHYAEALGVPAVMASPYPLFLPTGAYPNVGLPALRLGRLTAAYNRATHRFVRSVVRAVSRRMFGAWRHDRGLPPRPRGLGVTHASDGTRIPLLNAWSSHVAPDPPDWPDADACWETVGFWPLASSVGWEPPDALAAFLEAGPPPVYVGFGSMAARRPERTTRVVLDALRRTGLRAVLARGWGGLDADEAETLPETVHVVERVPHAWLFPRVAAVVHHGGAGTTAAGLRAGRPSVVCPFFGDQYFWARRVYALGAGPAPIPQRRLTADALASALREAIADPSMRRRAAGVGAQLRGENGVAQAVGVLERVAAMGAQPPRV
jgi:sterol 3beta-glucosyltransferase